ncbi:hypothetical protein [Botrimarina mediterranea]|uniref:hypothetical protein n=1 Tax=Botrimarina mediterranea TaxID=2528022 RepID=UPI0011A0C5E2
MSDDGKTIAAIGSYDKNGETHIWIGTGEQWHKYMDEIGSKIPRSLGVPNTPIDSGHFGGTVIRVPDLEPDPLDPHRRKHQTLWNDIALSADGSRLVYHAAANRVPSLIHRAELKLFDTRTGKLISQMDTGIDGRRVPCFRCLTLNRDGSRLFAHCMPKDAPAYNTIYETAKYESVGRWRGEPSFARFSPDGRWLVTNINGYVCLNDCENGRIRQLYAADAQQPSQFTVNSRSVRIVSDIEPGELTRNVRVLEYDLDSGDLARTVSFAGASPQCGPVLLGSYGRYLSALFGYSVGSKQPRHVMGLVWAVDDEPTQVADKVSVSRLWKVKGRSVEAEFVALLPMPAGLQEGYMVRLRTPKDEVINLPYAGLEVSSQKAAYLLYSVFGNGS